MGGKARSQSSRGKRPENPDAPASRSGRRPARAAGNWPPPAPQRVQEILQVLQQTWGHAYCELDHENAYQLLCATILSAQSTDRRINLVTPALFARYPDPLALAQADPAELEELIRSTGFYRMKGKHLREMARVVVARHDGEIPRTLRQLVALPGVARKTANVVLGVAFGVESGIVVDTHVQRVSARLGLTSESDPEKIERDLMALFPRSRWIDVSQQIIWHGRRVCHARKPECNSCSLAPHCPSFPILHQEAREAGEAWSGEASE